MWLITNYSYTKGFTKLTDEQIRIINKSFIHNIRRSIKRNKAGEYINYLDIINKEMCALHLSRFGKEIQSLRIKREWITKDNIELPEYMSLFKSYNGSLESHT